MPIRAERVVALALAGLLAALFAPTVAWLARTWAVHPYYSHGPIVPLVAAALAWRARASFAGGEPSSAGLAAVGAGVVIHVVAMRWAVFPLSAAALVVVLIGGAILVGGTPALRAAALPALLLAFAIPLPWIERLAPLLAAAVARGAAQAAGALGVTVVQTGAQLSAGDGTFVVGAPCSGLRSLLALATLAVVLAGILAGPPARRMALVFLAVPLALAANWLRLTGLLWMSHAVGADHGLAFFEGPAGPMLFVAALLVLVKTGRWLGCDVSVAPNRG